MKRGQQFQTLGMRMLNFGRTLMRNYVAPESGIAPEGGDMPTVWPQDDAPEQRFQPEPYIEPEADTDFEIQRDFDAPPQSESPRQSAPHQKSELDPRLLSILAAHEQLDAKRDRIREEKKAAFSASEAESNTNIQRDSQTPPKRRRGSASFDYVETSPLRSHDEGALPTREQAPQMPLLDEDQEDTLPVSESVLQRVPQFDDSAMDYADEFGGVESPEIDTPPQANKVIPPVQRASSKNAPRVEPSQEIAEDAGEFGDEGSPEIDIPPRANKVVLPVQRTSSKNAPRQEISQDVDEFGDEGSPGIDMPPAMNAAPPIQRAPMKTPPVKGRQETPPSEADDFDLGDAGQVDYSAPGDMPPIQRAPMKTPPVKGRREAPPREADDFDAGDSGEVDYSAPPPIQRAPMKTPPVKGRREAPPREADDFDAGDAGEVDYSAPPPEIPPMQRTPMKTPPVKGRREAPPSEADDFEVGDAGEVDYSAPPPEMPPIQRAPMKTPPPVKGRREVPSSEADDFDLGDSGEADYSAPGDMPLMQRAPMKTPPVKGRRETPPHQTDDFGGLGSPDIDVLPQSNNVVLPVQRADWHRETDEYQRVDSSEPYDAESVIDTVEGLPVVKNQSVQRMTWEDVDDEGETEPLDMDAIRAAIEATNRPPSSETPPAVQRMTWQDADDEGATEPLDMDAIRAAIEATNRQPPNETPASESPSRQNRPHIQRAQPYRQVVSPDPAGAPESRRQNIPQADSENADTDKEPLDVFEALSRAGMIPNQQRSEAAPRQPKSEPNDLLDFLKNAPPPPDVQEVIHRSPTDSNTHYESPADQVMRAETTSTSADSSVSEPEAGDVDVDKLAREVYSRLRNRLRIERERRDK
jgi:hypothetical protein